jgi:Peptidase family M23
VLAGTASAANAKVPRLIFPVVGPASYIDDFNSQRGSGRHDATDIMAPKRSLAVAAEGGLVKFWTTSAAAGCMLFLEGDSGTEYLYIHLNNDLTLGNDNQGKCVAGVAYAKDLASGDRVEAGEPIAFVGDSGNANGIGSHLHFEVHPGGRAAVNPFPHLNRAQRLLFAAPFGSPFTLSLNGTVVEASDGALELAVDNLRRYPGGLRVPKVDRNLALSVPPDVVVLNPVGALIAAAQLAAAKAGQVAIVWTERAQATLAAQLGTPFLLAAAKIQLKTA